MKDLVNAVRLKLSDYELRYLESYKRSSNFYKDMVEHARLHQQFYD